MALNLFMTIMTERLTVVVPDHDLTKTVPTRHAYVISYNNEICTGISHPLLAVGSAAGLQEQIAFVFTIIFI